MGKRRRWRRGRMQMRGWRGRTRMRREVVDRGAEEKVEEEDEEEEPQQ